MFYNFARELADFSDDRTEPDSAGVDIFVVLEGGIYFESLVQLFGNPGSLFQQPKGLKATRFGDFRGIIPQVSSR